MQRSPSTAAMIFVAALLAAPVAAQQALAPETAAPASNGNPTLGVATVKLEQGSRASKVIGSSVYNEQDEKIGSVDDLIMTPDDKVTVAVVSVGGFLGLGSKLVAIPWSQLRFGQDGKVMLPGATRDALNTMPSFTYNG